MQTRALLAAVAMTVSATLVSAEDCTLSTNYCVPLYGCIAATGERFQGQSYGQRKGPLRVGSSEGVQCSGNWRRTAFGGKASIACSDGRTGQIRFNYFNAQTGTVGGVMDLSDGSEVEVFAGHRVSAFLKSGRKVRGQVPACRAVIEAMLPDP